MPAFIQGFQASNPYGEGLAIRARREELAQRQSEDKFDRSYKERVLAGQVARDIVNERLSTYTLQDKILDIEDKADEKVKEIQAAKFQHETLKTLQSSVFPRTPDNIAALHMNLIDNLLPLGSKRVEEGQKFWEDTVASQTPISVEEAPGAPGYGVVSGRGLKPTLRITDPSKAPQRAGVDPMVERLIQRREESTGETLTPEEREKIYDIALGVAPRAAVIPHQPTEEEYLLEQLPKRKQADLEATKNYPKDRRSTEALIKELLAEYRAMKTLSGAPIAEPIPSKIRTYNPTARALE